MKLRERINRAQGEQVAAAVERILIRLEHADPRHDEAVGAVVAVDAAIR